MINLEKFFSTKGQFVSVEWLSEKKPAAAHKARKLQKHVSGCFRAGIDFSHLGYVKDGIRDGERGPVEPLRWGQWKAFPYVIEHKGGEYVRLYPMSKTLYFVDGIEVDKEAYEAADDFRRDTKSIVDWAKTNMKVEYIVDGKTVSRAEFIGYLTPSDAKGDDREPGCICVKKENLIRLCESDDK